MLRTSTSLAVLLVALAAAGAHAQCAGLAGKFIYRKHTRCDPFQTPTDWADKGVPLPRSYSVVTFNADCSFSELEYQVLGGFWVRDPLTTSPISTKTHTGTVVPNFNGSGAVLQWNYGSAGPFLSGLVGVGYTKEDGSVGGVEFATSNLTRNTVNATCGGSWTETTTIQQCHISMTLLKRLGGGPVPPADPATHCLYAAGTYLFSETGLNLGSAFGSGYLKAGKSTPHHTYAVFEVSENCTFVDRHFYSENTPSGNSLEPYVPVWGNWNLTQNGDDIYVFYVFLDANNFPTATLAGAVSSVPAGYGVIGDEGYIIEWVFQEVSFSYPLNPATNTSNCTTDDDCSYTEGGTCAPSGLCRFKFIVGRYGETRYLINKQVPVTTGDVTGTTGATVVTSTTGATVCPPPPSCPTTTAASTSSDAPQLAAAAVTCVLGAALLVF